MKNLFCFLFLLFLSAGCSVKEDRSSCPVFIKFSDRVNPYDCVGDVLITVDGGGGCHDLQVPINVLADRDFHFSATKGHTVVSVLSGVMNAVTDRQEVRILNRTAPDCIFALAEEFTTESRDETYVIRDSLCRQTAPVTMRFKGADNVWERYSLLIHSRWNGFDRRTLAPLYGDLSFPLCPENDECLIFFPRQGDSSLSLDFMDSEVLKYSFPLGRMIAETGYDWASRHLNGIVIELDCSLNEFDITINDWSSETPVEYII